MKDKPTFSLDFNSITGQKDIDQARGLRLVLAVIQDDAAQLASVGEEVYTDGRGVELCIWELVVGMAGAVALEWVRSTDKETAIEGIRLALMNGIEGVDNG